MSGSLPHYTARALALVVRVVYTWSRLGVTGERYVSEPLIINPDEREHLEGFVDESREHLDAIEVGLLEVEKDPTETAKINVPFRAFHTITGIGGFLNLRGINRLMHEVEYGARGHLRKPFHPEHPRDVLTPMLGVRDDGAAIMEGEEESTF
ncbi:MAG: Hpt domain-containing protein [Phycisphaerae bacterium]